MPRTQPFDKFSGDYEAWVDRHPYVYRSEVAVLRSMIPPAGRGIEIGVGTGRSVREGLLFSKRPSRMKSNGKPIARLRANH